MVALPVDAVKTVIQFTRLGGEIAETGFWLGIIGAGGDYTQSDLQNYANSVWTNWTTRWTTGGLNGLASTATKPVGVKATLYPAGDTTGDLVAVAASEVASGISTTPHPYQCSMVVSLRSAIPTKRGRGRMYLPLDGAIMGTNGQYHANAAAAVGAEMDTFLTAVNGLGFGGDPALVVVASHVAGEVNAITSIVTNTIPDIQRRRANREKANATDVRAI